MKTGSHQAKASLLTLTRPLRSYVPLLPSSSVAWTGILLTSLQFSYVLSGELTHRDSMGNVETLRRGQVQFTSAGTGVVHSEYNHHPTQDAHFLQVWCIPDQRGLPPRYYTSQKPESDKVNKLQTLIKPWSTFSPEEQEDMGLLPPGRAIPAHNSLVTRVSVLEPRKSVSHVIGIDTDVAGNEGDERWLYVHVVMANGHRDPESNGSDDAITRAAIKVSTVESTTTLFEGDGAYITGARVGERVEFTSVGQAQAEFVLFDLRAQT